MSVDIPPAAEAPAKVSPPEATLTLRDYLRTFVLLAGVMAIALLPLAYAILTR